MKTVLALALCATGVACAQGPPTNDGCEDLGPEFIEQVKNVLSDTTGRFFNDYPDPTPLTCELLGMLQDELKDDSVRYHFEHMHQRYGDPRAVAAFAYIERHTDFALAMALTTHWNPDTRIEAVQAESNYRRIRPMVCATKEHYAQLEEQDRSAVRYFIRVLETTPLSIPGSENATIHGVFMGEVVRMLDLFTGQTHDTTGDPAGAGQAMRMTFDIPEARMQQALADWRNWLEQ
jgi:hypothetical protein